MKMDMIQMKHTVRANTKNKLPDTGATWWGDEYNVESQQQPRTKGLQVSNKTLDIKIWSNSLRIRVPLSIIKEPLPKIERVPATIQSWGCSLNSSRIPSTVEKYHRVVCYSGCYEFVAVKQSSAGQSRVRRLEDFWRVSEENQPGCWSCGKLR